MNDLEEEGEGEQGAGADEGEEEDADALYEESDEEDHMFVLEDFDDMLAQEMDPWLKSDPWLRPKRKHTTKSPRFATDFFYPSTMCR